MNISERKFMASQAMYGLMIAYKDTLPVVEMVEDSKTSILSVKTDLTGNVLADVKMKPQINVNNLRLMVELSYAIADNQIECDEVTKHKAKKVLTQAKK